MSGETVANGASSVDSSPQGILETILRFPAIRLATWYRIAEIARYRGTLPETKFRLAKFLNSQRLDPATGRVEGRYGTDQVDGGMALAERYAWQFEVGTDRFWDDLKGLKVYGLAERVVAPAPGRLAVYALCLRADAIPSDLPEDLMRELRVWDLPEAEDPYEDAAYGRLTARPAPAVEPFVVRGENRETQQLITELAAAPRWEHPADSSAAAVAQEIRTEWQQATRAVDPWPGWEPVEAPQAALVAPAVAKPKLTPDLRCIAVADRGRAAEMTARVHRLMALGVNGKASPLYAKGFSQLDGFTPNGSSGLIWSKEMEKAETTPSAATGKRTGQAFGDDVSTVARSVMRRVWHSWRVQLGRGVVFLPSGTPEELSRSMTGDAWSDLHHTITVALRRSTESELVELLTDNIVRRNEWGEITFQAENLGRLAGWRLWRLINSRKNAHGHGPRREVKVAAHVQAWDEATSEERDRIRNRVERARELDEQREQVRVEERLAERAERRERWGLHRFEQPEILQPEQKPRRWAQQSEGLHVEEQAARQALEDARSSKETSHRAALARARAEKAARKGSS
ncbi:hypothetical protein [Streptomyces sp. NBC_00576]|uniref:hypothetical protein n=1 Tax=Streptomyces sp. NBC_00576 TaxID=2903665 RepID=UPI002E800304|nr:hypothetical protein [Streptomyces sp. NBC_00576]WUB77683.1 hypothetical protein OG734_47800 [Streptomyces sp. NBC_00576]